MPFPLNFVLQFAFPAPYIPFFLLSHTEFRNRGSAVGTGPGCGMADRQNGVMLSSPALGAGDRVVKLTTHLQLVPRSSKRGSTHPHR
jgi:hypothetical protein